MMVIAGTTAVRSCFVVCDADDLHKSSSVWFQPHSQDSNPQMLRPARRYCHSGTNQRSTMRHMELRPCFSSHLHSLPNAQLFCLPICPSTCQALVTLLAKLAFQKVQILKQRDLPLSQLQLLSQCNNHMCNSGTLYFQAMPSRPPRMCFCVWFGGRKGGTS